MATQLNIGQKLPDLDFSGIADAQKLKEQKTEYGQLQTAYKSIYGVDDQGNITKLPTDQDIATLKNQIIAFTSKVVIVPTDQPVLPPGVQKSFNALMQKISLMPQQQINVFYEQLSVSVFMCNLTAKLVELGIDQIKANCDAAIADLQAKAKTIEEEYNMMLAAGEKEAQLLEKSADQAMVEATAAMVSAGLHLLGGINNALAAGSSGSETNAVKFRTEAFSSFIQMTEQITQGWAKCKAASTDQEKAEITRVKARLDALRGVLQGAKESLDNMFNKRMEMASSITDLIKSLVDLAKSVARTVSHSAS